MAESVLRIRAEFDPSSLITGLRDAAAALERAQTAVAEAVDADPPITLDEALDEVESMVTQHCHQIGEWYETSALSANRSAFDLLVRAGRAEYIGGEPFGRMATIRLHPPVERPVVDVPGPDDLVILDPDCRAEKHGSCIGGPCTCPCHEPVDGLG